MPLPKPAVEREKLHIRRIHCEGYARADGLWDIEAHMTDTKTYSFENEWRGGIEPGEPIHEMWIRLTLDDQLEIRDIEAVTDHSPFEMCPAITPNFKRLIGLRIGPGWNRKIKEQVGGTRGCTHLVELLAPMATVAFQTIMTGAKRRRSERFGIAESKPRPDQEVAPAVLDTCHAWASTSPMVKKYMPQHYRKPVAED